LPSETSLRATYAARFRCIGSACEDTCCQGWNVPIDRATFDTYQILPAAPLPDLIRANLLRISKDGELGAAGLSTSAFAIIKMNTDNQCPLLSEERLCRIQAELGESLLAHTCTTYPRIVRWLGDEEEKALTLSCPEAARLVLLTPDLFAETSQRETMNGTNSPAAGFTNTALPDDFWAVRSAVLNLVKNRLYPLWQRMFLLAMFSKQLDSIAAGNVKQAVPAFLAEFESTTKRGALRQSMDKMPADRAAQLDMVLRLAGMMLHKSNVRPRFVECVQAFTSGIGNRPGATLETLAAQYALGQERYYAPFLAGHPYIMENFLINTIVRCQFPFGKEGMRAGAQPKKGREFAMLAAQFVLMRGLLIGVAGHHGEAFSTAHVVHTVQAASKHFEHHPEFLSMAHGLLVEAGLDGDRGMAILLRDASLNRLPTSQAADEATPASAGIPDPGPLEGRSA
jgi:lysine-N-methylase